MSTTTIPTPDLKTAMAELDVRVVEVENLPDRCCWVNSQRVLLARPGVADETVIAWAMDQAAQDRFPRPKDAPLPEWASSVVPGPHGETDGWEWQPDEKVWSRAPMIRTEGHGWEIVIEGDRQIASAPDVITDEPDTFGVSIETGWEELTPAELRKFAKGIEKAADELERLRSAEASTSAA